MNPEIEEILKCIQERGRMIQKLWKDNRADLDRLKEIEQGKIDEEIPK